MENKTIIRRRLFHILSISILILILILSYSIPSEDLRFGQGEIFELNSGWEVTYDDRTFEDVLLPHKFDVEKNNELVAKVVVPLDFPSNFKLRLRSSMQDVKMYVDEELVFQTTKPASSKVTVPEASVWYIVELPPNIQGKTLSMRISSNEKVFSGSLNSIYVGAGDTLLYKTILDQKTGLLMAGILLIFGVFALIVSLTVRSFLDNRVMYLGAFFILVGVWIFSETRLLQFFTGNRLIIGGISYMMLSLIPIPFILYLRDAVLIVNQKICTRIAIFFTANFLFNIGFQTFGIASFISSITFTNTMIFILLAYIVLQLLFEAIKLNNLEAKKFLMYISLLVLFLLIEIYYFYVGLFEYTSVFTRIGVLTFLVFIASSTFKQLDELILKKKEAEVMKRLAYTDILTGGNNRLAYERDLEILITDSKVAEFRVVLMDINDLKLINDRFGHSEGDRMIKEFYQIVKSVFALKANIYRLGGDEFTCILEDIDTCMYSQKIKEIEKALEDLSKNLGYSVNVAIGSDVFTNGGSQKIKDFLDHIDKLMYANKRFLKQS